MMDKNICVIDDIEDYIEGKEFSSGLIIALNNKKYVETPRVDKICEICTGKRIVHLGFADHIPLIKQKIENNTWLHGLLESCCSECFGVDINKDAVEYVKSEWGYTNICCANIIEEDVLVEKKGKWDYLVLGEILEHIDNPVNFISEIRNKYKDKIDKIIITVPNIICRSKARDILHSREVINTDHRYWFSPYTLRKIVYESGFTNCHLDYAERCSLTFIELVLRKVKKMIGKKSKYDATYYVDLIAVANF